jgi:cell division protein FtsQ
VKLLKKILQIAAWVLVLGYMGVALSFINIKEKQIVCAKVDISILDSTKNFFVEEDDVLSLFENKKIKLKGALLNNINLAEVEKILYQHPAIKKVEVYKTMAGILKIDIFQRNPIIRIINSTGDGYYIDQDAKIMPLSGKYTAHVLVATGNINQSLARNINKNLAIPSDGTLQKDSILNDLYTLGKFIYDNKLWKSQIEQLYINENNEIEMIPRIGFQTIILGTIEDFEEKFTKLDAIYNYGFNNVGWNKYKDINLKYKNQVICTKIE